MQRSHCAAFLAFCLLAFRSFAAITGVVMTPEGQPVSGARVSIHTITGSETSRARLLSAAPEIVPIASTQTDSKGAFTLDSPKDPTVALSIFARGFGPMEKTIERDEEVGALMLQKREMRPGTVTAGGKPVAGATVILNYDGYDYVAKTDAQGRYEAPDPKRAGAITVLHPDYAVSSEVLMTFGASAKPNALQRTLVAGSAFSGKVVSGEKDAPLAKATIFVDGWPLATTGDDGAFTIAHMPPKWKTITARKESLIGERAASKETSITIRAAKGATITGRVTDAKTRVPIAGATVTANTARFSPFSNNVAFTSGVTDAKGVYSLVVAPGAYSVMASHPAYEFKPTEANAVAGQQAGKDLSLQPLARVSGVVVDEAKRPVVVAVVDTEDAQSGGGRMGPMRMMRMDESTVSGPDGRFSMRVTAGQEMWVRAKKRGLPQAKSDALRLVPGDRKSGVVITIPSGIEVTGRAIDPQGQPLSGVAVTAAENDSNGPRGMMFRAVLGGPGSEDDAVRTASDGKFSMRVKEGTYDFAFKREGLAPKVVRGQVVSVTASPNVEATMEPAVEIAGRVTRGGTPLENVMVMAMTMGGEPSMSTTGPDGSFTLSGLAAGPVRLIARKEEDFVMEQRSVNAPARDVTIEVRAGGRVVGRVIEKGSGKPIPSFQAGISTSRQGGGMVMMAPPQMRNFNSDDGTFTLESVPPGAMVIVANAPGYASSRLNVTVEEGKELTGVELQLEAGVKLVGRVTGSNSAPLSDVRVRIVPSPTGSFAMRGNEPNSTTDANGEYVLEGLEAGEESVSFTHPKFAAAQKSVTLKGRESRLDVQLESGGRVTGTVVTESGAPVADAHVEASSGGGFESARTNASGAFEFESVTPGRYRFTASKTGLADGVIEDVDVTAGSPVQIVMKSGGTITGRLTGLTAQELTQASVYASTESSYKEGVVDANGNYRIEGVPGGTASVLAMAGSFIAGSTRRAAPQTVELAPGGTQQVDIAFTSDVVVSGRITRNGTPLVSGTVNFFPKGGMSRASASATTDNDGMYSVSGLEEGEYQVMVNDAERMNPYTTTYQVHGSTRYDIEYRTNSMRGRVLEGSSNEPLANVSVQLGNAKPTDGPRLARGAITDANGLFILDSVPPGSYTLTARKDGYANDVKDVYVGDSAPNDIEVRLNANAAVTINVVDARDNRPISGRAVAFDSYGRVADETRMNIFGDGQASALTLSVAPGTYSVTVHANDYAPRVLSIQSPSPAITVALTRGGRLEVRSKHEAGMRLRLIDSTGQPYPRLGNFPSTRELLPSPGTTILPNLAAGSYTLQLMSGDVVISGKQITIAEGQTTSTDL